MKIFKSIIAFIFLAIACGMEKAFPWLNMKSLVFGLNASVNAEDRRLDRYLTQFATKYRVNQNLANFIAPPFKVSRPSDKYLVYGKESHRVYDNKIKGREIAKDIDLKVDEANYSTEEYSLSVFISDRSLRNSDVPRLKEQKTAQLMDAMILAREQRVWDIAGSSSLIPGADIAQAWATPASATPVSDIIDAMKAVEVAIGRPANKIAMTYEVALSIIKTDEWKDYFKYTDTGFTDGLFTAISGLKQLGLNPQISGARGLTTHEGTASDPAWETMFYNKCLVFYSEDNPTVESQTFMHSPYTVMNNIIRERLNRERGEEIVAYEEIDELLVNANAGYLMYDVIA